MSGQVLILTDRVLDHFDRYRQRNWRQKEAGGQLFAGVEGKTITVELATGPRRGDRRSRTSYQADRASEKFEIDSHYREGLHFIGDWHTHPAAYPVPSCRDLSTISEIVRASKHSLLAFVLVIVGTDTTPAGICVLIHNGTEHLRLDARRSIADG